MSDVLSKNLVQATEELANEFPETDVKAYVVDVTNKKGVSEWIQDTKKVFGRLDGALNNAGKLRSQLVESSSFISWVGIVGNCTKPMSQYSSSTAIG